MPDKKTLPDEKQVNGKVPKNESPEEEKKEKGSWLPFPVPKELKEKKAPPVDADEALNAKIRDLIAKLKGGSEDEKREASEELSWLVSKHAQRPLKNLEVLSKLGPAAKPATPVVLLNLAKCKEDLKLVANEVVLNAPGEKADAYHSLCPLISSYLSCLVDIARDDPQVANEVCELALFWHVCFRHDWSNLPPGGGVVPKYRDVAEPFSRIGTQLMLDLVHDHGEHSKGIIPALLKVLELSTDISGREYAALTVNACSAESKAPFVNELAKIHKNLSKRSPNTASILSDKRLIPDGKLNTWGSVAPETFTKGLLPQRSPAVDLVLWIRFKAGKEYAIELDTAFDAGLYLECRSERTVSFETKLISRPDVVDDDLEARKLRRKDSPIGDARKYGDREIRAVFSPKTSGTYRIVVSTHERVGGSATIRIQEK
jgi:hypothetical protein